MTCIVVVILFSSAQAQNFTVLVGPPHPHQCVPFAFNVTGGKAPYTLTVSHFNQPKAAPVAIFPNLTGQSWQLLVNVSGGTPLQGVMVDSANHKATTGEFVVANSANSSCLDTVSSTESSSSSTATATNESSSSPSGSSTPLGSGAIAGVAIAGALIAAAALALGLYLLRKRKKRRFAEKPFIEGLPSTGLLYRTNYFSRHSQISIHLSLSFRHLPKHRARNPQRDQAP